MYHRFAFQRIQMCRLNPITDEKLDGCYLLNRPMQARQSTKAATFDATVKLLPAVSPVSTTPVTVRS
jgi:hypothetical protein